MVLVLLLIASFATPLYEKTSPNANIKTPQDALWWGLVTIAAVGYGDYYPVTLGGKLVGAALMFVGVTFVSTIVSLVASYYAYRRHKRDWNKTHQNLEIVSARIDEIDKKLEFLIKNEQYKKRD